MNSTSLAFTSCLLLGLYKRYALLPSSTPRYTMGFDLSLSFVSPTIFFTNPTHPNTFRCSIDGFSPFQASYGVTFFRDLVPIRFNKYTECRTASPQNESGVMGPQRSACSNCRGSFALHFAILGKLFLACFATTQPSHTCDGCDTIGMPLTIFFRPISSSNWKLA
ncbi:hypothetical protein HanXRQr2_Chr12g0524061 [Helianthus annuus]|uniref:Uncharacterized protein n=1 Tax=Helianthus annuus TaxID=4232 RepID=A0A9K3EQ80_HELAN|nr:hypothetical protein HanXRQr2_Chr12g0524061 [Helianthus annuus]KAJ0861290.1 hypothetical protein HanPSC8_Chr12g0504991 [Helianthus annuus]